MNDTIAARPPPPSPIDVGEVDGGRVRFENWRGEADRPEPEPPAPLPPGRRTGFAVVGLGRLSLGQILPAFSACRLARPVALVSGTPDKAGAVAAQYGIERTFGYDDIARLADEPDVGAVYIVTPNALHREHVLQRRPLASTCSARSRWRPAAPKRATWSPLAATTASS